MFGTPRSHCHYEWLLVFFRRSQKDCNQSLITVCYGRVVWGVCIFLTVTFRELYFWSFTHGMELELWFQSMSLFISRLLIVIFLVQILMNVNARVFLRKWVYAAFGAARPLNAANKICDCDNGTVTCMKAHDQQGLVM